jgi:hypothetical protein
MQKFALYAAAIVFIALAAIQATFFVFETHILVGSTLFRPLNLLMAAILFTSFAVWMIIANLDSRGDG